MKTINLIKPTDKQSNIANYIEIRVHLESKKTITFEEFKQWMTCLIVTTQGKLPGIEEWKLIKIMMDRVEQEKIGKEMDMPDQIGVTSSSVPQVYDYDYIDWNIFDLRNSASSIIEQEHKTSEYVKSALDQCNNLSIRIKKCEYV